MRTLNTICLMILFSILYHQSIAQSEEYTVESFQDVYTELTNYESVGILAEGNPIWEFEFPLNFEFPFYGSLYSQLIYRDVAWGSVTDDEDLGLLLMDFTIGYAWEELIDTANITSDVRFAHVLSNNQQAFVLEFKKMKFFLDPFRDSLDTYFNFQLWFYENGVIEARFGENHMDNNPIYKPGEGFYCYTSNNGVDTNDVCGPHMGISNPDDEKDAIGLSGSYDDYEIIGDVNAVLNTLPPDGWVIRFKPKSVGIFDPKQEINHFAILPNPASEYISVPINGEMTIFDLSGKVVSQGNVTGNTVNVSDLSAGMYLIRIDNKGIQTIGRFVKQ